MHQTQKTAQNSLKKQATYLFIRTIQSITIDNANIPIISGFHIESIDKLIGYLEVDSCSVNSADSNKKHFHHALS